MGIAYGNAWQVRQKIGVHVTQDPDLATTAPAHFFDQGNRPTVI